MLGKEKTENYLKTIYKIQKNYGQVRGADVAKELNVTRPTVSVAIKELRSAGYIKNYDNNGFLLTKMGLEKARAIEERFSFLKNMLLFLNVDKAIADEDACRMEHSLSDDSFMALKRFFSAEMSCVS